MGEWQVRQEGDNFCCRNIETGDTTVRANAEGTLGDNGSFWISSSSLSPAFDKAMLRYDNLDSRMYNKL